MAKNNPPNLTSYIQDARREGYKGTNREEAIKYLKNKNNEGDAPNYGTMKTPNFYMIPGSREKNTPGNFRDTAPNNYMTMANAGHEDTESPANLMNPPGGSGGNAEDDKKKKKTKFPKRDSLNPFSSDYTGIFSGSNPYIRRGSAQKSEGGTIFG